MHATTCHIGDMRVRSFDVPFWQRIPFRLFLGIRRPKRSILGMELAGEVIATGEAVERFEEGAEGEGHLSQRDQALRLRR